MYLCGFIKEHRDASGQGALARKPGKYTRRLTGDGSESIFSDDVIPSRGFTWDGLPELYRRAVNGAIGKLVYRAEISEEGTAHNCQKRS